MAKPPAFAVPKISRRALSEIRRHKSLAASDVGCGGVERKILKRKPITLRRPQPERGEP